MLYVAWNETFSLGDFHKMLIAEGLIVCIIYWLCKWHNLHAENMGIHKNVKTFSIVEVNISRHHVQVMHYAICLLPIAIVIKVKSNQWNYGQTFKFIVSDGLQDYVRLTHELWMGSTHGRTCAHFCIMNHNASLSFSKTFYLFLMPLHVLSLAHEDYMIMLPRLHLFKNKNLLITRLRFINLFPISHKVRIANVAVMSGFIKIDHILGSIYIWNSNC